MLLYHGTLIEYAQDIVNNGIDLSKSNDIVDFGKGFYTTDNYEFAFKTVANKINAGGYNNLKFMLPAIVVLEFDYNPSAFIKYSINYKEFKRCDKEWVSFVMQHRFGDNYIKNNDYIRYDFRGWYDIVKGYVADNKFNLINKNLKKVDYKIGFDKLEDIIKPLGNKEWHNQISFHTKKSLRYIKPIEYKPIYDWSEKYEAIRHRQS